MWWFGYFIDEAIRVVLEGLIEGFLSCGVNLVGLSIVDLVGRHQADADVVMLLVVPGEELLAEGPGVLDAAEAFWELGLIFERLEMAFRERVVIPGVGLARCRAGYVIL